ncbi:hypothetical protein BB559_003953 [Furculomyces boomerangus]|uniref:C2 NT-type domain-containing protein n=2 Tax=Harpellales TaxID=61421 RepID=A0A2T9YHR9_9FUNG|nr:hypothetical protein BB559_003953 [Furculomyces boomerangus]PVZ98629.1 hypothetical protein BB558_005367 [Smittium angustum]
MSLFGRGKNAIFNFDIDIHSLDNVTLISSLFYIKWSIKKNSGRTGLIPVTNHSVQLNVKIKDSIKINISKDNELSEYYLSVHVYHIGNSEKRLKVGFLNLNLSEYVKMQNSTRRYILQQCRINATLRISINATQIDGPTDFVVPQLNRQILISEISELVFKNEAKSNTVDSQSISDRSNSSRGISDKNPTSSDKTNNKDNIYTATIIDDSSLDSLSPYQSNLKKNNKIIDDILFSTSESWEIA